MMEEMSELGDFSEVCHTIFCSKVTQKQTLYCWQIFFLKLVVISEILIIFSDLLTSGVQDHNTYLYLSIEQCRVYLEICLFLVIFHEKLHREIGSRIFTSANNLEEFLSIQLPSQMQKFSTLDHRCFWRYLLREGKQGVSKKPKF